MLRSFLLLVLIATTLAGCGRRGPLERPGGGQNKESESKEKLIARPDLDQPRVKTDDRRSSLLPNTSGPGKTFDNDATNDLGDEGKAVSTRRTFFLDPIITDK